MKLVFVLPGGGACGRWQAGVLKYLFDMGVFPKINLVCGTSVGGLNTLLIGKYLKNFEKAADLWASIKSNKDIFNGMLQFNNFFDYVGMAGQVFKSNKGKSVLDPVGLYHLLDREFGDMFLKDTQVPVVITTTDIATGEKLIFSTEKNPFYKAADLGKATSAIPLAFPAVEVYVENKIDLQSDGGCLRNNPVCYAIESGATHIILIGTSPDVYPRREIKNNVLDIALRIPDVIMHANEEASWDTKGDYELLHALLPDKYPQIKIYDIYPEHDTGSALNFGNVEQFGFGYNFAKDKMPPEIIEAFLK
jgi:predicted acylesterase/phospholipase RssA